jgi:hypothetical protein
MLPALDNFVSYGPEMFKSRPDYRSMMLDIYKTAMESDQLGENDRVNGCKLAESMMLNLRDHIDDVRARVVCISDSPLTCAPARSSRRSSAPPSRRWTSRRARTSSSRTSRCS